MHAHVVPNGGNLLRLEGERSWVFARADTPRWILVNDLGAEVLNLCDGRRSLNDISEVICKKYDRPLPEVRQDVLSFWSDLEASRFLAAPPLPREPLSEVILDSPEVYVTTRCNQSCPHCGVRGAFPEGDMSPELFREIARQSASLGASRIAITGGEPFVRDDLLDLLSSIEGILPVQILTNGTLIDGEKARELARLRAGVQVSLDGASRRVHDPLRGEGTFDLALRALRILRDAGVDSLRINSTIQQANARDVLNILRLAEREAIKEVSLMPLVPGVDGQRRFQCADPESLFTAKRQFEAYDGPVRADLLISGLGKDALSGKRWCAPGQSPTIGPDGSVFPCNMFARTPYLAGVLPRDTLEQALHSKAVADVKRSWEERPDRIEECSSCVWKHFCHAGCPAFAYRQHGTLFARDCFCAARKRLYSDIFLGGQANGDRPTE